MNLDTFKNNPKTAFLASRYGKLLKDEADTRAMMEKDPSIRELAEHDIASIQEQKKSLEEQMRAIFAADKEEDDSTNLRANEVILEVRAGAGGNEAALFAAELLDMYKRFAES